MGRLDDERRHAALEAAESRARDSARGFEAAMGAPDGTRRSDLARCNSMLGAWLRGSPQWTADPTTALACYLPVKALRDFQIHLDVMQLSSVSAHIGQIVNRCEALRSAFPQGVETERVKGKWPWILAGRKETGTDEEKRVWFEVAGVEDDIYKLWHALEERASSDPRFAQWWAGEEWACAMPSASAAVTLTDVQADFGRLVSRSRANVSAVVDACWSLLLTFDDEERAGRRRAHVARILAASHACRLGLDRDPRIKPGERVAFVDLRGNAPSRVVALWERARRLKRADIHRGLRRTMMRCLLAHHIGEVLQERGNDHRATRLMEATWSKYAKWEYGWSRIEVPYSPALADPPATVGWEWREFHQLPADHQRALAWVTLAALHDLEQTKPLRLLPDERTGEQSLLMDPVNQLRTKVTPTDVKGRLVPDSRAVPDAPSPQNLPPPTAKAMLELVKAEAAGWAPLRSESTEVGERQESEPAAEVKLPKLKPWAMEAWRARQSGMTVTKVAELLTRKHGEKYGIITQPRVSEQIRRAAIHAEVSGLAAVAAKAMPGVSGPAPYRTFDPAGADKGERNDGRADHIRQKMNQIRREE